MRRRMDRRTAGHNATRVKPVPLDSHHPFLPSFPSFALRSSILRSLSLDIALPRTRCVLPLVLLFCVFCGVQLQFFFLYESATQGFPLPFAIFPLSCLWIRFLRSKQVRYSRLVGGCCSSSSPGVLLLLQQHFLRGLFSFLLFSSFLSTLPPAPCESLFCGRSE